MNEEFHFRNALMRIQPTESAFQNQSNSLLGIDYPFKESSLSYTNKPLDVKDSVYLRFCFLLDFFSIRLVDVLENIVLRDANRDENKDIKILLNDFKYNYNNKNPLKDTLVNHVDEFIELLKEKEYDKHNKDLLLEFARQMVIESYDKDLFVGDTYELFLEWLINICSYLDEKRIETEKGIETEKVRKNSCFKVLFDYNLITLDTMRIWLEAHHVYRMRELKKISDIYSFCIAPSETDIINFTDKKGVNDWAYLLSNWEFYKKITQDVIAYQNFSILSQLDIKLIKKKTEELGKKEITIQASALIDRMDKYSYILIPLKQRRRDNKKEDIFEKIKNVCLKSEDDYMCFLFCNLNIYSLVKLKPEHYKLLYYSCCLNVTL